MGTSCLSTCKQVWLWLGTSPFLSHFEVGVYVLENRQIRVTEVTTKLIAGEQRSQDSNPGSLSD